MKEIVLKIEDKIFAELESSLVSKHITASFFGTTDEFLYLLVKAIRDGKKEVIIYKKKKKRKRKKKNNP